MELCHLTNIFVTMGIIKLNAMWNFQLGTKGEGGSSGGKGLGRMRHAVCEAGGGEGGGLGRKVIPLPSFPLPSPCPSPLFSVSISPPYGV